MNRITKIKIDGTEYAMNFSVSAAEAVFNRYGDLNVNKALFVSEENKNTVVDVVKEIAWLLDIMSHEGAKHLQKTTGEEYPAIDAETVLLMPMGDVLDLHIKVLYAVSAGMSPTVEVKPDKKNEETEAEK